jgi:hypothetical protein
VFAPSPILANATASAKLASRIASALAEESLQVQAATSSTDTVLTAAKAPWARVQLGATSAKADVARFSDPAWVDSVARALYRAIGTTYARQTAAP